MKRLVLACALVLGAATVATPRLAHAQDTQDPAAAEARTQYQLGTQAFQAKKYAEAATHFEAAAAARSNAVALYTAGLAWDLAGKSERAADAYSRALDVPGLDTKQATNAKDRVAALEKTLGTIAVQAPDGWKVQLDQQTEAPVPTRLHGAPGAHSLMVKAPGKPVDHRDVTLEAGKVVELSLKDEPQKREATPTPDPVPKEPPKDSTTPSRSSHESYWTIRRVAGVGVAGLGVAVLGAGAVLGIEAKDAETAYNARPSREGFDHASSLQTWTNVAFIAGAVALAGGIVLVVLPDDDGRDSGRVRMGLGPTGATVGGTF